MAKKLFDSDLEAALSFQRGEEKGFEYFFNKLRPPLLWFAQKYTKDKDDAEDAVEMAFITTWEKRSTLNHPKIIRQYLYTSVLNGVRQAYRFSSKFTETFPELVDNTLKKQIESETYGLLYAALSTLPLKCRQIVTLFYIKQLSVKEIEKKMGLKKSGIKTQLARGLSLLRKKYDITDEEANKNYEKLILRIYNAYGDAQSVANLYGVSYDMCSSIKKRETWKYLTQP